jgi:hypothetical protein
VQARAVTQCAETRHSATGELRHGLAADARPAGAEKDDVFGTVDQPLRGVPDGGEIIGFLGQPQQRQRTVRMARPDPGQRIYAARQGVGKGRRGHTVAADMLLAGIIDRLQDGHGGLAPNAGRFNRLWPE